MYKLVAIDLDGTLLNSYSQISTENKNAIKNSIEKGVEIVIASGRPISSAKSFANEIGANNYIICGNGALLYDIKNEKILYDKFIDKKKILEIIKFCDENSIFYSIYTGDFVIANSLNYNVLFYNNENKKVVDSQKTKIKVIQNIYNYIEQNENVNVLKMTICDKSSIIFERSIKRLRQIKGIDVLDVEHMARKVITTGTEENTVEYFYTEITTTGVNKWSAIQELAKKLNIKEEEIIAIGDNRNDKEMIENAGLGIIMGNSAPYMKQIADEVVESNNNNGVAQALKKYILNK